MVLEGKYIILEQTAVTTIKAENMTEKTKSHQ